MSTSLVNQLSRLLASHRGQEQAITIDAIQSNLGLLNRRETEQLIEEHLEELPFVLVACGRGLYIPTKADEINTYLDSLEGRFKRMWHRRAVVINKARRAGFIREGDTFLDGSSQQELFA